MCLEIPIVLFKIVRIFREFYGLNPTIAIGGMPAAFYVMYPYDLYVFFQARRNRGGYSPPIIF